jgi:hypothetical protein
VLRARRGLTRLWIAVSVVWTIGVVGLFLLVESDRWWGKDPIVIPKQLAEQAVVGKTVEVEKIGRFTFPENMTDDELTARLRLVMSEQIERQRNLGRSDRQILDGLIAASAEPERYEGVAAGARKAGYSDKEIIAYLAAANAGGKFWENIPTKLPDGTSAIVYAPGQPAADDATRKYWENAGGWHNHRWTYWGLLLVVPIMALYALGWAVGWIVAGFRSQ